VRFRCCCFATALWVTDVQAARIIDTVAGGGVGDGLRAVAQALWPQSITVDAAGNVFVAEGFRGFVRRIDATTGLISTVAGNGRPGVEGRPTTYFCGDGGPATAACLDQPSGVAVDAAGNVYIADTYNNRVRRVDAVTGVISTAAGNGTEAVCGDGGPATEACVWMPTGLAIDTGGNLLIAAYGGLRRVDATTGLISIIAGGGSAACQDGGPASEVGFDDATAVTVDRAGNILVADYGNGVVCRLDAVTHLTSVIPDSIGCGMGGVAVDSEGNVFFGATLVCRYDAGSGATTIVAGDGEYQCAPYPGDGVLATDVCLDASTGLAVDPVGNVLVGLSYRVARVDRLTGLLSTVGGNGTLFLCGEGGLALNACLGPYTMSGVTVDRAGDLLVADQYGNRVWRVDARTQLMRSLAGNGSGGPCADGVPATATCLRNPTAIALDAAGNLYVAEDVEDSASVRRVDAETGVITTIAGGGSGFSCGDGGPAVGACLNSPQGLAVDGEGDLFIADEYGGRVRRVDVATGTISTVAGGNVSGPGFCGDGGPATSACVFPHALALDASDNLFIADEAGDRVRRVDATTGLISTVAGKGRPTDSQARPYFCGDGGPAIDACLDEPVAVALDPAGNLFIGELANHRVRRVDAVTGVISTAVGTATYGFCGDGGPGEAACLRSPVALAIDASGALFIADADNSRVRRVTCTADTHGDGLGDPCDPSDASGLQLRTVVVQEVGGRKRGRVSVRFGARLAADASSLAELVAARAKGLGARVYATVTPPSVGTPALASVRFQAHDCAFVGRPGRIPARVACATRGAATALGLERLPDGSLRIHGSFTKIHAPLPPDGPLRLVLGVADVDYQDAAERCLRRQAAPRRLRCVGSGRG